MKPAVQPGKLTVKGYMAFLLIGLVFIAAGSIALWQSRIDPTWKRVEGQIVSYRESRGRGSTGSRYPTVRYFVDSRPYSVEGKYNTPDTAVGQTRTVAYDAADPTDAKLVEPSHKPALIFLFPAVGILIVLISIVSFVRSRRRQ